MNAHTNESLTRSNSSGLSLADCILVAIVCFVVGTALLAVVPISVFYPEWRLAACVAGPASLFCYVGGISAVVSRRDGSTNIC